MVFVDEKERDILFQKYADEEERDKKEMEKIATCAQLQRLTTKDDWAQGLLSSADAYSNA